MNTPWGWGWGRYSWLADPLRVCCWRFCRRGCYGVRYGLLWGEQRSAEGLAVSFEGAVVHRAFPRHWLGQQLRMRTRRRQAGQGNVFRWGRNWVARTAVLLLGLVGTACAGAGRTIEETESLRVAAFWLVFIILSLMVEKMFHFSEHSLEAAGKKG
eukprot:COSAG02_NODE_6702_length_3413_cov_7.659022_2_plen_156_part_00